MITLNERTNKRKNWIVPKSDLLSVKQTKIIFGYCWHVFNVISLTLSQSGSHPNVLLKLLKLTALGLRETDNINRMITITWLLYCKLLKCWVSGICSDIIIIWIILSLFAYCYQFFIVMKIAMPKMIPLRGVYSLLYLVNNLS